jgi:hypothetical protein
MMPAGAMGPLRRAGDTTGFGRLAALRLCHPRATAAIMLITAALLLTA